MLKILVSFHTIVFPPVNSGQLYKYTFNLLFCLLCVLCMREDLNLTVYLSLTIFSRVLSYSPCVTFCMCGLRYWSLGCCFRTLLKYFIIIIIMIIIIIVYNECRIT